MGRRWYGSAFDLSTRERRVVPQHAWRCVTLDAVCLFALAEWVRILLLMCTVDCVLFAYFRVLVS